MLIIIIPSTILCSPASAYKSLGKQLAINARMVIEYFYDENYRKSHFNSFETGKFTFWKNYGHFNYKGYIIFADPYNYHQKKINFLLGSDCSHFVHRVYQLNGLEYPYAKTRHLILIAKAQNDIRKLETLVETTKVKFEHIDHPPCWFKKLFESFRVIDRENALPGDLVLIAKREGILGTKGHVGILIDPETMEHANAISPKKGFRNLYNL